jgi:hypothetical protein
MSGKHWIQDAVKKPGALHKALHVPAGKKIPVTLERKAAHKPGLLGERARLALTLRHLKK